MLNIGPRPPLGAPRPRYLSAPLSALPSAPRPLSPPIGFPIGLPIGPSALGPSAPRMKISAWDSTPKFRLQLTDFNLSDRCFYEKYVISYGN